VWLGLVVAGIAWVLMLAGCVFIGAPIVVDRKVDVGTVTTTDDGKETAPAKGAERGKEPAKGGSSRVP
jgi:hypothetical protein